MMRSSLKKVSLLIIAAICFAQSSTAQLVVHSEDFENVANVGWDLNNYIWTPNWASTTNSPLNKWVVNDVYLGATIPGIPPIVIPNTDQQPAGITNGPTGRYMHILADTADAAGIQNCNYVDMAFTPFPQTAEYITTQTAMAFDFTGLTGVTFDFWWIGGDASAFSNGGGQLYYSIGAGAWIAQGPLLNSSTWQFTSYTNPVWDNQNVVRFAFVFNNDMGAIETTGFGVDDIEIYGYPPCQVELGPDRYICAGDSVLLDPWTLTPTSNFSWSTGELTQSIYVSTPGTYYVDAIDSLGCQYSDTINVYNAPPLHITNVNVQDDTACSGFGGEINITTMGGVGTHYYSIDGGLTDTAYNIFTGLGFGTYHVMVRDFTGCWYDGGLHQVYDPPNITITTDSMIQMNCNVDGQIDVQATGGASTLYYSIDTGNTYVNTTGHFPNLGEGDYQVYVTDFVCTTIGNSYELIDPTLVIDSVKVVNENCNGFGEGKIFVYASGGDTTNYTYYFNGSASSADSAVGLTAGMYEVIVQDTMCSDTVTVQITQPGSLYAQAYVMGGYNGVGISCYGANTGALYVETLGGTAPYNYEWFDTSWTWIPPVLGVNSYLDSNSNMHYNDTITQVSAGTYYVTVTDDNGCFITDTIEITQNPEMMSNIIADSTSCTNYADGSVEISMSGGVAPYSYQWSAGSTSAIQTGLSAGQYWVIVEDSLNCVHTQQALVHEPYLLEVNAEAIDVTCHGLNDGVLKATPFNGTPGYSFVWNYPGYTPVWNGQQVGGIYPSTNYKYIVTVTDKNGCTATDSVWMGEPDPLVVTQTDTVSAYCVQVPYGSNTGQVTIQASGGVPNNQGHYNFVWDMMGTFLGQWDNYLHNQSTVTTAEPGFYPVLVTDSNGCSANFNAVIPLVETLTVDSVILTHNDCYGAADGIATAYGMGGCGLEFPNSCNYTYEWLTSSGVSTITQTLPYLIAGEYSVTVTDESGCSVTESIEITEPEQIEYSVELVDQSCYGGVTSDDGQIHVTVSGGLADFYTLEWGVDPLPFAPAIGTETIYGYYEITDLPAGDYQITIVDTSGCVGVPALSSPAQPPFTIGIGYPVTVAIDLSPNNLDMVLDCYNVDNGHAEVINPDLNLVYEWYLDGALIDNGPYTNSVSAGNLEVVAYYPVGLCETHSLPVTITEPPQINVNAIITPETCEDANDGKIELPNLYADITGGTPFPQQNNPYNITWSPAAAANPGNFTLHNLTPGVYTMGLEDGHGCLYTVEFDVPAADPLVLQISNPNDGAFNGYWVDCNGNATGEASLTITGGAGGNNILWDDPLSQTNLLASGLEAGIVTVTVTDANGCVKTQSQDLTEPQLLELDLVAQTDISCFGAADGEVDVTPTGGVPNFSIGALNGGEGAIFTISNFGPGATPVTITDANGCQATLNVTIDEPSLLQLSHATSMYGSFEISCYGEADGVITPTVVGGTPDANGNYLFELVGAGNNELEGPSSVDFESLVTGSYNVLVTDANGCVDVINAIVLNQPDEITAFYTTDYTVARPAPYTVQFVDESTPIVGVSPVTTRWEVNGDSTLFLFGEYANSEAYTFHSPGEHEVTIVATNNNGICEDRYSEMFVVQGLEELNVFSPNGDGVNDYFYFKSYGLTEMSVLFFNRWGDKVYEMFGPGESWDGVSMNGTEVPEGVYFYVLQAKGEDGADYAEKGSVTIYR